MLKQSKKLLSVALVVIMCLTLSVTVFATVITPDPTTGAVNLAINKNFQMPIGTPVPAAVFNFDIYFEGMAESWVVDSDTNETTPGSFVATRPTLVNAPTTAQITIPAGATGNTSGDILTVHRQAEFNFTPGMFPGVGMYVFTITENESTSAITLVGGNVNETEIYSEATYEIRVVIANCDCTTPATCNLCDANGRRIASVITLRIYNNDGTEGSGKVDPTPGTWNESEQIINNPSELSFTNMYIRVDNNRPPTDHEISTLAVAKVVAGSFGDRNQDFPFSVTIHENPVIVEADRIASLDTPVVTTYTAIVVNSTSGLPVEGRTPYIFSRPGNLTQTFDLQDNQEIRFVNLPIGTRFVAAETNSYAHIVTGSGLGWTGGPDNATLSTPTDEAARLIVPVGNSNTVTFTNTRTLPPQTGLTMNDLPFVAMILLAMGAVVGFVVIKVRKSKREQQTAY